VAKKQKKIKPKEAPTKRQLSRWQRQMRIRRIVIIAAAAFLAGILSWVGYGYYKDRIAPFREVVIKVNDASFTMGYYVKMLDAYTASMNSTAISDYSDYIASMIAENIIQAEVLKQEAKRLGIEVTSKEIDAKIEETKLPNNEAYRDIISAGLFYEKLRDYFDSQLPDTMEQANVQVMLVESQEVANEVITKIETGGNFTALVDEFSCNPKIEGDLGWLPKELMPNTLIGDAAFNITPGKISQPIYDESATKNVGYWLIEVSEKEEYIRARAMLLGSKAEAEEVKAELASGNFSSLAEKYSQHKSKTEGGELGWLKQGDMGSEAFDEVAFNLTLNEVSEPVKDESVQTTGGYWIVKVVDKGEHQLETNVREELRDKRMNDWFVEREKNSKIENLLDEEKKSWAIDKVLQGR
jgi:parvulin-like peptidyl-prolyl isomerase